MAPTEKQSPAAIFLALMRHAAVEPRLMGLLLQKFESPRGILEASADDLREIQGLGSDQIEDLQAVGDNLAEAADYIELLRQRDIQVVSRLDMDYPQSLFELNDPPSLFFWRGRLPDPERKRVTVAGTRRASNEGIELTVKLCRQLAEAEVEVLSSLRKGIDAAVHVGVDAGRGRSYAVLEGAFDEMPSDEAMPVALKILHEGGILSEHLPEAEVGASGYYGSNRILAALGQAVVFTEFYANSERTLDLLDCCHQIGKLCFVLIDPEFGAFSDEASLSKAVNCGAIPMEGLDKIDDIIKTLV